MHCLAQLSGEPLAKQQLLNPFKCYWPKSKFLFRISAWYLKILFDNYLNLKKNYLSLHFFMFWQRYTYPAVTYAASQHQGHLFWIVCMRPAFLRSFSRLQLIQNSAPSVAGMRQCDIQILPDYVVHESSR